MLPTQLFQLITITADIFIFVFIAIYVMKLHDREKELERKQTKMESNYHKAINDGLLKEKQIIEDATSEADHIIAQAQRLTTSVQVSLDEAMQKMAEEMQKQALETSQYFTSNYQTIIHQIANSSLSDLQKTTKELHSDLEKQADDFRKSMLPTLQKELDEYKAAKMKETEEMIGRIIQKASQDIFNKTISLEDHHKLMLDALEKARKEGMFDS